MEAHSGFLTVKTSGLLKTKTHLNSWCILYCGKSSIPPRLDIYEDQTKTDPTHCKKSIDIADAKWSNPDTFEPAFSFSVKNKRYIFFSKTNDERNTWVQFLCCISLDLFQSNKSLKASGEGGVLGDDNGVIMQDNCLYTSTSDVSFFDVIADNNGSCAKLGFHGMLKLCFDSEHIKLLQLNGTHPLAEWTYYSVRSFGASKTNFNITVGKKSSTGEGKFSFLTVEGDTFVRLIDHYTKKLKERERGNQISPSHFGNDNNTPGIRDKKSSSLSSNSSFQHSLSPKSKQAPGIPSPKPISPVPGHIPLLAQSTPNAFDAQFKKELNLTIGTAGVPQGDAKQPLEKTMSGNSRRFSSDSLGRKGGKKELKEKEKAEKQKEKEEKKIKEKLEKEKKKQEEKQKKNAVKGKEKVPIPSKDYIPEQHENENEYSEAYESPPVDEGAEGIYAECDNEIRNEVTSYQDAESKVYNEPWGALSLPIQNNLNDMGNDEVDDEFVDNVYSSPMKVPSSNGGKLNSATFDEEEERYEDVGVSVPPPIIPPKFDSTDVDDSVYDHFSGSDLPEEPENVYGLNSAKSLKNNYKRKPPKPTPKSDVYETVD